MDTTGLKQDIEEFRKENRSMQCVSGSLVIIESMNYTHGALDAMETYLDLFGGNKDCKEVKD
jgi:hypothetical protein